MANSYDVKKTKEQITFIKELMDQICDNDLISNMFCWFKFRKHDQEIQNFHEDDKNNGDNDNSIDCLNTEEILLNLGEVHVPIFDESAKIGSSQSNVCCFFFVQIMDFLMYKGL